MEKVKAVPVQGTLKQIFILQTSSLVRLVLPYVFWHKQLCCSPALVSRMPEIAVLSHSDPACAQGSQDALQFSVLLKSLCLKKLPCKKHHGRAS